MEESAILLFIVLCFIVFGVCYHVWWLGKIEDIAYKVSKEEICCHNVLNHWDQDV